MTVTVRIAILREPSQAIFSSWCSIAGFRKRRALTFEVGIQNSGLAIVILIAQLKGLGGAAAIAAIWGVWHLVAGILVVSFFRTMDRIKA